MIIGGKKEVETLTSTIQSLTDKLMVAEKAQSEQASSLAELKDELEVGQMKELLTVDGANEEFADQFAMHFSSVQARSRKGDKINQKHNSHYFICHKNHITGLVSEESGFCGCE